MAARFVKDERGATFLEFTVVFPLVLAFTFGLVDLGLLMFNWAEANRATYAGARFAAVNDPVAIGINATIAPSGGAVNGYSCVDADGDATANCTAVPATVCTGTGPTTADVECVGGTYTADPDAFSDIVGEVQKLYYSKRLDPRQISIAYEPLPLGYAGQEGGFPMNITVSLRCLKQQIYFVAGLFNWVFPPLPEECEGIADPNGFLLPAFSTTLPAEDLTTNSF